MNEKNHNKITQKASILTRMMSKRKFPEPPPDPELPVPLACAPKLRNLFGFIIN